MIYSIIDEMKQKKNIIENIDELLNTIKEQLNNNFDIIDEFYNKLTNEHLNKETVLNKFNKIEDNNYGLKEIYKNNEFTISNSYRGYGVIGLVIKNNISIYNQLEIISLLIQTRNSIIIETEDLLLTIFIKEINKILCQLEDYNQIVINDNENNKLEESEDLDLLIYIGNKKQFNKLNIKCEKKFYGIGNYELYIDTELDQRLIEESKNQNVKIYKKETDIDSLIRICNKKSDNYCVSIMSNNSKNIEKFIRNIKSSYTLVNIIPTLEDRINICPSDLLIYKSIITYK